MRGTIAGPIGRSKNTGALIVILLWLGAGLATSTHAQERISTQSLNDAVALNNRGLALYQKGKVDEAIALFREALTINPAFEEALGNLGTALDSKGKDEEAVTDLNKALAIKPSDSVSQSNLGLALYHEKKYADSIAAYEIPTGLQRHGCGAGGVWQRAGRYHGVSQGDRTFTEIRGCDEQPGRGAGEYATVGPGDSGLRTGD
jgi:hypothetical protein